MLKAGFDLSRARVLITNDDGIHASGIQLLEELVRPLVREVVVVAPETEQSGVSHATTTKRPLRLKQYGDRRYSLTGTPPDCVLFALAEIMRECPPDLVLSGINDGQNVAEDVHYSGTVAACFEAGLAGIPALAFSQERTRGEEVDFSPARKNLVEALHHLTSMAWPDNVLMSVNFPCQLAEGGHAPLMPARLGRRVKGISFQKGEDPRGRPFYWNAWTPDVDTYVDGAPDTDLAMLRAGFSTVTAVRIDPTDGEGMSLLRRTLHP